MLVARFYAASLTDLIRNQSRRSHWNENTRMKAEHARTIMSRFLCKSHADTNNDENMESAKKNPPGLTNKPEGRVLVLYTGGTIGMVRNEQGGKYQYIIINLKKL